MSVQLYYLDWRGSSTSMPGSEVEPLPAVAGVYSKPVFAPVEVMMSKLDQAVEAALVVNVPVAVLPSSNVTPESVEYVTRPRLDRPQGNGNARRSRRNAPDAVRPMCKLSCEVSVKGICSARRRGPVGPAG